MISGSFGSKTTDTKSNSQSDPWDVTIPDLTQFLSDLNMTRSLAGPTGDQLDAFEALKKRAAGGNPFTGAITDLANDQLTGVGSRSGMVDDAYNTLKTQLGDVANGKNLDFMNDPTIKAMLSTVGNDVQNRVNGLFSAAGRPVTGNAAGQQAIGKGVTEAQLPILFNEYARQQGRTDAAARDLASGGYTAATTGQGLDTSALAGRSAGVDTSNKAIQAGDYAENAVLNLDQQLKDIPINDMSKLASLLLPVAGLGGQQQGNSTSTTTGGSLGFSGLFSDERVKENIEKIGETDDGQNMYRFQYKGDPTWQVGLIAQEVEKVKPAAVKEIGGVKAVDIKKATNTAAAASKRKGTY